jgi:mRNA interferase RelE/StbE
LAKYKLGFDEDARAEWNRLDSGLKAQFQKVIERRLENPHVPAARLSGGVAFTRLNCALPGSA